MKYDQARPFIKDGDLIAVKRRSGPLAVGTRLVTKSPYTHTGIAVWAGQRLLLAQANGGGINFVPLSQEDAYAFDVFTPPVDGAAAVDAIWQVLATPVPYGFGSLLRIFLFLEFGIPLPPPPADSYICSALSAHVYQLAGWKPDGLPSIPWPGAVVAAIGAPPRLCVELA